MAAAAAPVAADGFRNPPESASAVGVIGGKVAHIDDASAVTINPANIADFERPQAMASVTFGYATKEFTSSLTGQTEESEDPWAVLPSIFAATPIGDGPFVAGLGLTVPFGRFTKYDDTVSFGQISPYFSELKVINVNPCLATRLTDTLTAAVGLSFYYSDLEFNYFPGIRFDGDGEAFGANAAITWKPIDGHTLAITYRTAFDVEYEGDFETDQLPPGAAAFGATSRSSFETELNFPAMVAVGYGVRLSEALRAEVNVEWIEASRNSDIWVDIANNNFLLHPAAPSAEPLTLPQDWDDNWTFGAGLEWLATESLTARAGYMYLESPSPTSTTMPVAAEEDQSVVSVGLGYRRGAHNLDAAYAIGIFDGLTVDDHVSADPAGNSVLNGGYDFNSHLFSVAYSLLF